MTAAPDATPGQSEVPRRPPGQATTPKPAMVRPLNPEHIPADLRDYNNWILWQWEWNGKKWTKVPYTIDGKRASTTDPNSWSSFEDAWNAMLKSPKWGLGFVFSPFDPYTGIDFGDCLDGDGALKEWAREDIEALAFTYIERSPSGKGLKAWVMADLAQIRGCDSGCRERIGDGEIEIYDRARFFTVTGAAFSGAPLQVEEHSAEVRSLLLKLGKLELGQQPLKYDVPSDDIWRDVTEQDREKTEKVLAAARENFRDDPVFQDLIDGGAQYYPGSDGEPDASRGDGAWYYKLAQLLEANPAYMHAAFMATRGRFRDAKKMARRDYHERTIRFVLQDFKPAQEPDDIPPVTDATTGLRVISIDAPQGLLIPGKTDVGNAQRLVMARRDRLRYNYAMRKWICFDERRWLIDDGRAIEHEAKEVALMYAAQALKCGDQEALKHATRSLDSRRIEAMIKLARTDLAVREDELDRDPWLLNFQNGTLDLRNRILRPHRREDLITKVVHHDFQPDADCPTWKAALDLVLNSDALVNYFQRVLGYALTGVTVDKAIFVVYGPGDNGKSTILHTGRRLIEEYSALVMVESLMTRKPGATELADLTDLRGARLALTSETEEGQRLSEGRIKRLSQGIGKVKACRKYENPTEFPETWKLIIDGNHRPVIRGGDAAIWNRLHLIPFSVTITEKDKHFAQKLDAEAGGILRWMVDGCAAWQRTGLTKPDEVGAASEDWQKDSDVIAEFFEDRCDFYDEDVSGYEGTYYLASERDLWEAFVLWCRVQAIDTATTRRALKLRLLEKNCIETRVRVKRDYAERAWKGVRLAEFHDGKDI